MNLLCPVRLAKAASSAFRMRKTRRMRTRLRCRTQPRKRAPGCMRCNGSKRTISTSSISARTIARSSTRLPRAFPNRFEHSRLALYAPREPEVGDRGAFFACLPTRNRIKRSKRVNSYNFFTTQHRLVHKHSDKIQLSGEDGRAGQGGQPYETHFGG
ncbi:hypothetical protein SDC9_118777 [bioreactor metagenome]|uniref:Uncharacterized protein n=1 Tax=bioreactor metagenome TaxID=1076179 RepID=A0A645C1V8_9ZZZZ